MAGEVAAETLAPARPAAGNRGRGTEAPDVQGPSVADRLRGLLSKVTARKESQETNQEGTLSDVMERRAAKWDDFVERSEEIRQDDPLQDIKRAEVLTEELIVPSGIDLVAKLATKIVNTVKGAVGAVASAVTK